jgi:hypothetical protein
LTSPKGQGRTQPQAEHRPRERCDRISWASEAPLSFLEPHARCSLLLHVPFSNVSRGYHTKRRRSLLGGLLVHRSRCQRGGGTRPRHAICHGCCACLFARRKNSPRALALPGIDLAPLPTRSSKDLVGGVAVRRGGCGGKKGRLGASLGGGGDHDGGGEQPA